MLINILLSYYYFEGMNKDFLFKVLNNEHFSSALRINLFTKIIKDEDKKRFSKIVSKIMEMSNIRNYFAHITPQYFSSEEPTPEKVGWFPHPKDPTKTIDLEKTHERFFELEKETLPYIISTCKALGVKFPVRF